MQRSSILMAPGAAAVILALGAALLPGAAAEAVTANPIRRVVNMLQMMQKKVAAEGEKEEALYDKYMCFCKTGSGDLSESIGAAESKVPKVQSNFEEAEALKVRLDKELTKHTADRSGAKDAVAQATALRAKEAAAFAKESSDSKTNIAALDKAITSIETGAAGTFLQTPAAAVLRRLTVDADMGTMDRELATSFLSQGLSQGYVPKSGQIIGILKEMKDTMEKSLADIIATENQSISDFEALVGAKNKEIKANSKAIESKLQRTGEVGVEIEALKEDLDDTTKALIQDKKFLADLDKNCATKESEWETRSKTRTEEMLAIAETIKILNDDDALELFKKTLPTPTLLQTRVSGKEVKEQALRALHAGRAGHKRGDPRLDLVALALRGHSSSFDKVVKMIDGMVTLLGKEQSDDDSKKAYCEASLDKSEDEKKGLELTVKDLEKAIDEAQGTIASLAEELAELDKGIKALDKQVAEATETRKAEHELYEETMAADGAAKEVIAAAKNRLAKFYDPKMYTPPPKVELSREERIVENMGGAVLVQVSAHSAREAARGAEPGPPPETWSAYATKTEEKSGVMTMLDMLVGDLDKEIQEMTVEEKDSQAEYEQFTADSAAKRAADAKAVTMKEGTKADLEVQEQKMEAEKKVTMIEAMVKAKYIQDLHGECDWLVANFETRKEARSGEVESLKRAKAILSGSDYALVQTAVLRGSRLRGSPTA